VFVASIVTLNVTEQKRDTGSSIHFTKKPVLEVQSSVTKQCNPENEEEVVSALTADTELALNLPARKRNAKHWVLFEGRGRRGWIDQHLT
jgi:hypothetical protein